MFHNVWGLEGQGLGEFHNADQSTMFDDSRCSTMLPMFYNVWGLQGQGLGEFHDADQLTMFADYRVPVALQELGILQYSADLQIKVSFPFAWAPVRFLLYFYFYIHSDCMCISISIWLPDHRYFHVRVYILIHVSNSTSVPIALISPFSFRTPLLFLLPCPTPLCSYFWLHFHSRFLSTDISTSIFNVCFYFPLSWSFLFPVLLTLSPSALCSRPVLSPSLPGDGLPSRPLLLTLSPFLHRGPAPDSACAGCWLVLLVFFLVDFWVLIVGCCWLLGVGRCCLLVLLANC